MKQVMDANLTSPRLMLAIGGICIARGAGIVRWGRSAEEARARWQAAYSEMRRQITDD